MEMRKFLQSHYKKISDQVRDPNLLASRLIGLERFGLTESDLMEIQSKTMYSPLAGFHILMQCIYNKVELADLLNALCEIKLFSLANELLKDYKTKENVSLDEMLPLNYELPPCIVHSEERLEQPGFFPRNVRRYNSEPTSRVIHHHTHIHLAHNRGNVQIGNKNLMEVKQLDSWEGSFAPNQSVEEYEIEVEIEEEGESARKCRNEDVKANRDSMPSDDIELQMSPVATSVKEALMNNERIESLMNRDTCGSQISALSRCSVNTSLQTQNNKETENIACHSESVQFQVSPVTTSVKEGLLNNSQTESWSINGDVFRTRSNGQLEHGRNTAMSLQIESSQVLSRPVGALHSLQANQPEPCNFDIPGKKFEAEELGVKLRPVVLEYDEEEETSLKRMIGEVEATPEQSLPLRSGITTRPEEGLSRREGERETHVKEIDKGSLRRSADIYQLPASIEQPGPPLT